MRPSRELKEMTKAARRAGESLMRRYHRRDRLRVELKGRGDFVSEADREAERVVMGDLSRVFPTHGFLAEESPARGAGATARFIVDPLDGTTNFLHGIPHWAVSIGLEVEGELVAGVIYDPAKDELFAAERGRGAWLGRARLQVAQDRTFARAVVSTGIPHASGRARHARYLPMLAAAMHEAAAIRRLGAAALDLAYVAAGRHAMFWELGLKPWDLAAGIVLVEEAGGRVTTVTGEDDVLGSGEVLATNGRLHGQALALLRGRSRAGRAGA